jgi:hypothetical protein
MQDLITASADEVAAERASRLRYRNAASFCVNACPSTSSRAK